MIEELTLDPLCEAWLGLHLLCNLVTLGQIKSHNHIDGTMNDEPRLVWTVTERDKSK